MPEKILWQVEFSADAMKTFIKLDKSVQKKIEKYIDTKLNVAHNPTVFGSRLHGPLSPFYKFRVGDYRLIAEIIDNVLLIEIVSVGHGKEIYVHMQR